ncbi:SRPBCC domain-containing protein [Catenuloplanes sp. NPDC051500]|uniref:SRPBCC domain-containing protein n=1 Tax=Catenuloplanes sp. NPDC051500 TaxID=3363959 RepID=UPI0037A392A0
MYTTRVSRHSGAAPAAVYRALLDPGAIARWRVPDGMSSRVHEFEAREGGAFRVSLSYDAGDGAGKSGEHTDTYRGRFVRLVPDALVVEELEFETDDPAMRGTMTMTTTLTASADGGTEVAMVHEGVPDAVSPADNEIGARMALDNLCRYAETDLPGGR